MDRDTDQTILDWLSPDLLTEFMEELREAGYNIGISQYIAAHDLVLSLISQNILLTPDRLGSFLGPILCSSSVEQEDFRERCRKWVELVKIRNPLLAEKSTKPDNKLEVELKQISKKSRKFKFALFTVFITLPLLLLLYFSISNKSPRSVDNKLQQPEQTSAPDGGQAEELASSSSNQLESIFNWQIPLVSVLLVSGVAYFAWRRWWSRQAHLFLQRQETTQTPKLEQISFQGLEETLFKPLLVLKTAQRLRHRIRVSANTLNINKTIHGSLQNGGWFTPAYGYRQVFPEYLFLIDRTSIWDHQAKFIEQLTHQLRQSGVYITTYFFDGDPRVCFSSVKGICPQTLPELSSRYQQHRLVVFADTEIFSNIQTAGYAPWVEQLFSWQNPVAITPKPLDSWGSNEFLLAQSLILLPLSDTGIQVLGQVMQEGSAIYRASPEVSTLMPTMLKIRPKRWIERNPPTPEQGKEILVGLKAYLGDDGFYWLAACAVFPQLRWHITLYLGNMLKAQEGCSLLERCSLPNLARLPWYRYGYMPDWFRGYLIATLTHQQQEEVRLALQQLLITVISGSEGTLQLEIAKQDQSVLPRLTRSIIRILSKQASENTALKDYIFLGFMSGKSKLAVEVPEEIAPILRKYSQTNRSSKRFNPLSKCFILPTLLALTLGVLFLVPKIWRALEALKYYNEGNSLIETGEYEEAITAFDKALANRSDFAQAWTNKGYAQGKLGKHLEKFSSCDRATKVAPEFVEAWNCKGLARFDLKQFEMALQEYNQAVAVDPNYYRGWLDKGEVLLKLGRPREAIDATRQVLRLKPNYFYPWTQMCQALYELEQYQDAKANCEESLKINSDYPPTATLLEQVKSKLSGN